MKPAYYDESKIIFAGTGLQITVHGQRHLGAAVGSEDFKQQYVNNKINAWIDELIMLEKIAKVEPHIAYCAFVFGIQHRYTYLLRTIPDISQNLKRLDDAINQYLVKHLVSNYTISDMERRWFSLPPRLGGMGRGSAGA